MNTTKNLRFIDLFAGIGGFRLGFEQACTQVDYAAQCVFTSEIKPHAVTVYKDNFPNSELHGDITQISAQDIPNFDVLLAGFPCQAFSCAGKRYGFADTRGTLFFEIERILKIKQPTAFILENVEGLVGHDKEPNSNTKIGRTLSIILEKLQQLGYQVTWQVLDAQHFGLAQSRKRIFIVGHLEQAIDLKHFPRESQCLDDILQQGQACMNNKLSRLLLENYSLAELYGKSIKDKRGGSNNIHSWELGLKGKISAEQQRLLNLILLYRRNKKWAEQKGIQWMDGMPLTLAEINTFYQHPELQTMLQDLVAKNYLKFEHPKDVVLVQENGKSKQVRLPRTDIEKGYNIVAGKLSYEISTILDPKGIAPTLVATDLDRVVVPDTMSNGLRTLTLTEQCRLFGFPDDFKLNIKPVLAHDLFGNTVPVKVVTAVATLLIRSAFFGKIARRKSTLLSTKPFATPICTHGLHQSTSASQYLGLP
jgi:DNA (cytosine-5)-methyltransferase 1